MKMKSFREEPVFTLKSSVNDFNGSEGETVKVYVEEVKHAEVGKAWAALNPTNCGRGEFCESMEIVYKTSEGVAFLHRKWGTTDSDNPLPWEDVPELIWFEFGCPVYDEDDNEGNDEEWRG